MSHDINKLKFLKKIIGSIGYKLVDKNSIKIERIINNFSVKIDDILQSLINKKKIKKIIQVGANDGKSDDFLFKCFNEDLEALLIEPIEDAFIKLERNYKNFQKVKCLNLAVDVDNKKKEIFSVNKNYYEFYKKKYKTLNVDWLNILSSFNKQHLINHGIKKYHINSKLIECQTLNELINTHNYEKLDLLIIDTEGHDFILVNNFIETMNIRPIIIFEWVHFKNYEIEQLLMKLKNLDYNFLQIGRDLVCFQKGIII